MMSAFVVKITVYENKAFFAVHQCCHGKRVLCNEVMAVKVVWFKQSRCVLVVLVCLRLPLALLAGVWYTFFKPMHMLRKIWMKQNI